MPENNQDSNSRGPLKYEEARSCLAGCWLIVTAVAIVLLGNAAITGQARLSELVFSLWLGLSLICGFGFLLLLPDSEKD